VRVVFDATAIGSGRGGDETFLTGVREGLALEAPPGDVFPLLVASPQSLPAGVRDNPAFPVQTVGSGGGTRWYGWTLPRGLAAHRDADLVHTITHAPLRSPVPVALAVGDLSFVHQPATYPPATRLRLSALVPRQAARARVVVVPSEFSRQDLLDTFALPPEQVHVVPNRVLPFVRVQGAERLRAEQTLRRLGAGQADFVLYVGNLHPRKNVPALIRAFVAARRSTAAMDGCVLLVAGASWWRREDEQLAARDAPSGWVRLLGRVEEPVRRLLLERARAAAYVSTFEGFGLPPLEAMAAGVPVVTSCTTALPEVCAGAAVLVDPANEADIAAGLVSVTTDEPQRRRLRAAGLARAASYDAGRTGRAALAALRHGTSAGAAR